MALECTGLMTFGLEDEQLMLTHDSHFLGSPCPLPCHPRPGEEEWLSSDRPNQRLDIAVSIAVREGGVSEVAGPQPKYERLKPTPHANQPP
jgi:hypothetical protein